MFFLCLLPYTSGCQLDIYVSFTRKSGGFSTNPIAAPYAGFWPPALPICCLTKPLVRSRSRYSVKPRGSRDDQAMDHRGHRCRQPQIEPLTEQQLALDDSYFKQEV